MSEKNKINEKNEPSYFYDNFFKELKKFKWFKNEGNIYKKFLPKELQIENKNDEENFFYIFINNTYFHFYNQNVEIYERKNIEYYESNINLWIFINIKKEIKKLLNFIDEKKKENWNELKNLLNKKSSELDTKIKSIIRNKVSQKEKNSYYEIQEIKIWIDKIKNVFAFNKKKKSKLYWNLKHHLYDLEKEFDHIQSKDKNEKNKKEAEPWIFFQELIEELKSDSNIWNNFFIEKINFLYLNHSVFKGTKNIENEKKEGYYLFENAISEEEINKLNNESYRDSLNYQKLKEDKKIFQEINVNLKEILTTFKFNDKYLFDDIKLFEKTTNFLEKKIEKIEEKIKLIKRKIDEIKNKYKNKDEKEKWLNFKINGLSLVIEILSNERSKKKEYLDLEADFGLKRKNFIDKKEKEKKEIERQLNFELNYRSIEADEKIARITEKEIEGKKWILFFSWILFLGTISTGFIDIQLSDEENKLTIFFWFLFIFATLVLLSCAAVKMYPKKNRKKKIKKAIRKIITIIKNKLKI